MNEDRMYQQLASMERAQEFRRHLVEFAIGAAFGLALLVMMAAPWDQLQ